MEMINSMPPPTKPLKKRHNKNKKKNWAKIDASEIEDSMVYVKSGKMPSSLKLDSELFDIQTSESQSELHPRIQKARNHKLKVDCILKNPALAEANLRHTRAKKSGLVKRLDKKVSKKMKIVKRVLVLPSALNATNEAYDLWSQTADKVKEDLFSVNKIAKHTLAVNGKKKKPKHMYKGPEGALNTTVVDVPHHGASYNPDADQHQLLLAEEHNKEVQRDFKAEKLARAVYFDPTQVITADEKQRELGEGIMYQDEEEESDEEEGDSDDDEIHTTVTVPKTRKKRRKEMMVKQAELERQLAKEKRIRDNDVFRTKSLISEIKTEKKELAERKLQRDQIKIQPQLGYLKFETPDQDYQLSSELRGSLRELKPCGDLLTDRQRSLEKRCVIEARTKYRVEKRKKKKEKVKYQEKREFRLIDLETPKNFVVMTKKQCGQRRFKASSKQTM